MVGYKLNVFLKVMQELMVSTMTMTTMLSQMQKIKEDLEKDKSDAFGRLLGFLLFAIEDVDDTWLADKEV